MTKEQLVESFNTFFSTVLSTPAKAFADLLSPDVVWENYLPAHVPFGGKYEGIQELVKYLTQLSESIVMGPLEYLEYYAETDTNTLIVVGKENESTSKTTGRTYNMPFVWIAKFSEEGRLIYCREHNDTREMSAAFD